MKTTYTTIIVRCAGNTGIIDTRGIRTPAGYSCGRLNYCIYPNRQVYRFNTLPQKVTEMYAKFQFEDGSVVTVQAFNSALAKLFERTGRCTLEFSQDVSKWYDDNGTIKEQRDIDARRSWVTKCIGACENQNKMYQKSESVFPIVDVPESALSGDSNFHTLLPQVQGKTLTIPNLESYSTGMDYFLQRIDWMNRTFEVPTFDVPTDVGSDRIHAFMKIIKDEVNELDQTIDRIQGPNYKNVDLVGVADCLGDLIVFCLSESRRWGIPIVPVLHAIMDSQESKLVDGKPIWNESRTKFQKGPDYVAPEPKIKEILDECSKRSVDSRNATRNPEST